MTTTKTTAQPPPRNLGPPGKALWRSIAGTWHLDQREVELLATAARQCDDNARLEVELKGADLMIPGSAGQLRVHPAVSELRQGRLAVERLLQSLSLPPAADESPRVSRRNQLAAQRRWGAS